MANFNNIKQEIDQNVNTNGQQAITGAILNRTLKDMIDEVDAKKQDTLVAGSGISISGNVISATGGGSGSEYYAGEGINIDSENVISTDFDEVQEKLVDGENIKTVNGEPLLGPGDIQIQGTNYSAGDGISINLSEVISVEPSDLAGFGLTVDAEGDLSVYSYDLAGNGLRVDSSTNGLEIDPSVVATKSDLEGKQDTLAAGANIQISGPGPTVISATDTTYSAGNGLNLNGTTFSVKAGSGLGFDANGNLINTGGGGGGQTLVAGDGIEIDQNDAINVKLGNGLQLDSNNNIEIDPSVVATQSDLSVYLRSDASGQMQNFLDGTGDTELKIVDGSDEDYVKLGAYDTTGEAPHIEIFENGSGDTKFFYDHLERGSQVSIDYPTNSGTIALTDDIPTPGAGLQVSAGNEIYVDTTQIQEKLTAGANIQINGSTISATDTNTTYSAGSGLSLNGTTFSVDTNSIQEKLTAGQNITIQNNVISATGGGSGSYSAGDGIDISNNTISVDAADLTGFGLTSDLNNNLNVDLNSLAGDGLTYNGGGLDLSINTASGLSINSNGELQVSTGGQYWQLDSLSGSLCTLDVFSASGQDAFGVGYQAKANGDRSVAIGYIAQAYGDESVAIGRRGYATGYSSFAGPNATAGDEYGHGRGAVALGNGTNVERDGSVGIGANIATQGTDEISLGKYNKTYPDSSANDTKIKFSIGNGTGESDRSNVLEIKQNGDAYLVGVGGFLGKNAANSQTLQDVINSGGSSSYSAGTGINITNNTISVDSSDIVGNGLDVDGSGRLEVNSSLIQEKLTAGANIQINGNTISATDTNTTYSAGSGLSLNGTTFSVNTNDIQEKLVSGTNIKTVNGNSLLGSGNIVISGGSALGSGQGINIDANDDINVKIEQGGGLDFNASDELKINPDEAVAPITGYGAVELNTDDPTTPYLDVNYATLASSLAGTGLQVDSTDGTTLEVDYSTVASSLVGNGLQVDSIDGTTIEIDSATVASDLAGYFLPLEGGNLQNSASEPETRLELVSPKRGDCAIVAYANGEDSDTRLNLESSSVSEREPGLYASSSGLSISTGEQPGLDLYASASYVEDNGTFTLDEFYSSANVVAPDGAAGIILETNSSSLSDTGNETREARLAISDDRGSIELNPTGFSDGTYSLSFPSLSQDETIATLSDIQSGSYTAGSGIDITNDVISVDTTTIQEKLTAGQNITISGNVISATGGGSSSYSAGTGINIDANNVISNTAPSPWTLVGSTNIIGPNALSPSSGDNQLAFGQNAATRKPGQTFGFNGAIALGVNTQAAGNNAVAIGANAVTASMGALCLGYHAITGSNGLTSAYYATALGYYATATNAHEIGIGACNNSINTGTTAEKTQFTVGNGSSASARSNLIEAKQNNDIYVVGVGGFDGTNASASSTLQAVISGKQDTLTAGSGISISGNVISATGGGGTTYSAGSGLNLNGTTFSVDTTTIQEKLTAGSGISISGNTISATGGGGSCLWSPSTGTNSLISPGAATGVSSDAAGTGAITIGYDATADGDYAFACGGASVASGDYSFAANNGTAEGDYSAAFSGSGAYGDNSFAAGGGSTAGPDYSVALGGGIVVFDDETDPQNPINAQFGVAIGDGSTVEGEYGTAIGGGAVEAGGTGSVAIGSGSTAAGLYDVAVAGGNSRGNYSFAASSGQTDSQGHYASALSGGYATGEASLAAGQDSNSFSYSSIALGLGVNTYDQVDGSDRLDTNAGEVALGRYNYSESGIIFSIGCGYYDTEGDQEVRENSVAIDTSGNIFIKGLGGYTGQTISGATSLQDFLNNL